jgi:hypothetical protein
MRELGIRGGLDLARWTPESLEALPPERVHMPKKTGSRYPEEFKVAAVQLVRSSPEKSIRQLAYELGISGDDGLPRRVAARMVVEATLRATLCVAAIPHAHVHGIDRRFASSKRMVGEQPPQSLGVVVSTAEGVVVAAPATAVRGL